MALLKLFGKYYHKRYLYCLSRNIAERQKVAEERSSISYSQRLLSGNRDLSAGTLSDRMRLLRDTLNILPY